MCPHSTVHFRPVTCQVLGLGDGLRRASGSQPSPFAWDSMALSPSSRLQTSFPAPAQVRLPDRCASPRPACSPCAGPVSLGCLLRGLLPLSIQLGVHRSLYAVRFPTPSPPALCRPPGFAQPVLAARQGPEQAVLCEGTWSSLPGWWFSTALIAIRSCNFIVFSFHWNVNPRRKR